MNAWAQLFSPRVIGQFSNTTKTCPEKEGLFLFQTTNSPTLEHISFSNQVFNDLSLMTRTCLHDLLQMVTPIPVGLTPFSARLRHPTTTLLKVCLTPLQGAHNTNVFFCRHPPTNNVRATVTLAASSGFPVLRGDFSRFKAAHIFLRVYEDDVRLSCSFDF